MSTGLFLASFLPAFMNCLVKTANNNAQRKSCMFMTFTTQNLGEKQTELWQNLDGSVCNI